MSSSFVLPSLKNLVSSLTGKTSGNQRSPKRVSPKSVAAQQLSQSQSLPASRIHIASDSISGQNKGDLPLSYVVRQQFYDSYDLGKILGRGASAEVYIVRERSSGLKYACKIIHRDNRMNDSLTMSTEMLILKRVHHEHIISLHELFETRDTVFLVMELADGGDLIEALVDQKVFGEEAVKDIFRQLLEAVSYLHSLGIVHRDLKLDNLLYSKDESNLISGISVKIADFGLSAVLDAKALEQSSAQSAPQSAKQSKQIKREKMLKQMWGTTEYFAPEVYDRAYGRQADVWALGCILFEMLTGELAFPYRETKVPMIERFLFNGGKKPQRAFERKPQWERLSSSAKDLIKGMLKVSAVKRLSVDECLQHHWLSECDIFFSKHTVKHVDSLETVTDATLSPSSSSMSLSVSSSPVSSRPSSASVSLPQSTSLLTIDPSELTEALRILRERVDRRARRYRNLVAEVQQRQQTVAAAAK